MFIWLNEASKKKSISMSIGFLRNENIFQKKNFGTQSRDSELCIEYTKEFEIIHRFDFSLI